MRVLILTCFLSSSLAFAQEATDHHHLGFYLRLDFGAGGLGSNLERRDLAIAGGFGSFGFAIGGALSENLILAGHLFGLSAVNPNLSTGGSITQTNNTEVGISAVGPQLTYYFMPLDLFFSGTIGLSRLYATVQDAESKSNFGLALQLGFGKEWWMGSHWGLGIAAQLSISANQDRPDPNAPNWSTAALGIAFSTTYN